MELPASEIYFAFLRAAGKPTQEKEGRLNPAFAANVDIPLAGARGLAYAFAPAGVYVYFLRYIKSVICILGDTTLICPNLF